MYHFQLCREAFTWYGQNPPVLEVDRQDEFVMYLAANDGMNITTPHILTELNNKNYYTFDELKAERDKVLNIEFCNEKKQWNTKSICSCRVFQKEFMCKHILARAFYHRYKKCPQEGYNKSISQKAKKGRIARAKKALVKQ